MPIGEGFAAGCLGNLFVWWVLFIAVTTACYPLLRRFRMWQARRRFIEREGIKLQNPQNAEVRFQLACLFAQGRSWRRAEAYAAEAVKTALENPLYEGQAPFHFLKLHGEALYHRGRYEEAVETWRRALQAKSDTGYAEVRLGLGKALYRRGKAEKALEFLRQAVRENGSNLEGYFRLAQAAAGAGRAEEAAEAKREFRKVAAVLPRFARQRRFRWRMAFLLFPLARRVG